MYTLRVKATFEAAHCIPGHPGACSRPHGHRYEVEAEFASSKLDELGMVMDFGLVKRMLDEALPDHRDLNEILTVPTSAENLARWLYERLQEKGLPIVALTLWETENCGCRYVPDR